MLGSVADAEDVVQEAFLRYHAAGAEPDSPKAYLATITTRLAIEQLRSARTQREVYPGEWLPEPLSEEDVARHAEMADSLSLAYRHLLERLSPVERAVFLLREVFHYRTRMSPASSARSPANARQILSRAHARMDEGRRRFEVSRAEREEVAPRYLEAWETGDTDALVAVLAPDATATGTAAARPRRSASRSSARCASRRRSGWRRQALEPGVTYRAATVNGGPGVVYRWPDGSVAAVQELDVADGVVVAIRTVLNPDKLARLSAGLEESRSQPSSAPAAASVSRGARSRASAGS